jgi:glycine/D-amino acid oxidase-like deaminating enzyme
MSLISDKNLTMNTNTPSTSGAHFPFWLENVSFPTTDSLKSDIDTDVLIIGGGIAGLTTAYFLTKSGRKVTVIESRELAGGESGRTTAHLTAGLDDRYYYLRNIFGEEATKLAAESHSWAVSAIESIAQTEGIDCHFRRVSGYLFLHPSDKPDSLHKEFEASQAAGINTILRDEVPGFKESLQSLEFPEQGQFHIGRYLSGVANAVLKNGGQIFTNTHADDIDKTGANANGFKINAQHIVVATNTPVNNIVTMHTKQHPYRTYVIGAKIRKGTLPYALWWDTGDMDSKWTMEPYHYVRLEPMDDEFDLLIAGGEDHKTGQADAEEIPETERYARLEAWARQYFPVMGVVSYRWSGQCMEPVDSLGYMGKNPGDDNIYIITGDSGNGMTHTTIGAKIIHDLISGIDNPWASLYDPSRVTVRTADDFVSEGANMAKQYLDWVLPGDLKSADDLQAGQESGVPR